MGNLFTFSLVQFLKHVPSLIIFLRANVEPSSVQDGTLFPRLEDAARRASQPMSQDKSYL
jgi:hypothetical protein